MGVRDVVNFQEERILYVVTFNTNGGSNILNRIVIEGQQVNQPPNPTKSGSTFDGWYYDNGTFANAVDFPFTPDSDITIYSKWEQIEYSITYELNGGTNEVGAPTDYVTDDTPITLPTPTKENYTFNGWFLNADFSGVAQTVIPRGQTGNLTYYAKFTITGYSISLSAVDGNNAERIYVKINNGADWYYADLANDGTDTWGNIGTIPNAIISGNNSILTFTNVYSLYFGTDESGVPTITDENSGAISTTLLDPAQVNPSYASAELTITDNTAYTIAGAPSGYTVSGTSYGIYNPSSVASFDFYSLDNGTTWVGFDNAGGAISISGVTQIKFKVTIVNHYYGQISSTTLGLSLDASISGEQESQNYTITSDVTDLVVSSYLD